MLYLLCTACPLLVSRVYYVLYSNRAMTAVKSSGSGKMPLSFDYVIAAENASSGSDSTVPIIELNDASLTSRSVG